MFKRLSDGCLSNADQMVIIAGGQPSLPADRSIDQRHKELTIGLWPPCYSPIVGYHSAPHCAAPYSVIFPVILELSGGNLLNWLTGLSQQQSLGKLYNVFL